MQGTGRRAKEWRDDLKLNWVPEIPELQHARQSRLQSRMNLAHITIPRWNASKAPPESMLR